MTFNEEATMNRMSLGLSGYLRHGLRWSEFKQKLTDWQHRVHSRTELLSLSDRCLQDISVARHTADFDTKPFWMV